MSVNRREVGLLTYVDVMDESHHVDSHSSGLIYNRAYRESNYVQTSLHEFSQLAFFFFG